MSLPEQQKATPVSESPSASLGATLNQCRELLEAAKLESARIIQQAIEDAQALKNSAYDKAYEELLKELFSRVDELVFARNNLIAESKDSLLQIVIEIAQEVLGEALEIQPQSIVARIERALAQSFGTSELVIVVHPERRAVVENNLKMLSQSSNHASGGSARQLSGAWKSILVREDTTIALNDARIESPSGTITAFIEPHMASIKDKLLSNCETKARPGR